MVHHSVQTITAEIILGLQYMIIHYIHKDHLACIKLQVVRSTTLQHYLIRVLHQDMVVVVSEIFAEVKYFYFLH